MQNSLFPYQVVHFLCIYQLRYIDKIFRHIVLQRRMRDHNRMYGAPRPHRFLLRFERRIAIHVGKHDHLRDRFSLCSHWIPKKPDGQTQCSKTSECFVALYALISFPSFSIRELSFNPVRHCPSF